MTKKPSPAERAARAHWFRYFRAHAMATNGGGFVTGEAALGAWQSAKAQVYFRAKLRADCAAFRRRSRAARKAWKARRAA